MADIFKQFIRHMDGVNRAAVADAAGKAIAEHCDKRIDKARKALLDVAEDCSVCSGAAAEEGNKGDARAWRAVAGRLRGIAKRM